MSLYRIKSFQGRKRVTVYCHIETARVLYPLWARQEPRTEIALKDDEGQIAYRSYAQLLDAYAQQIEAGKPLRLVERKALAKAYQQDAKDKWALGEIAAPKASSRLKDEARACYRVARALMGLNTD